MTITTRAYVRRDPLHFGSTNPWRVGVFAFDDETDEVSHLRLAERPSMPEALQAVQVFRAEVERELTEEMHESLATRRAERAAQLEAEQPPVPVKVCVWCRNLGHVINECPSWRATLEATR